MGRAMTEAAASLTVPERAEFLSEIAAEICALAPRPLRVVGGLFLLSTAVDFGFDSAHTLGRISVELAIGICLTLGAGWLGGGKRAVWQRLYAAFGALVIANAVSVQMTSGGIHGATGVALLLLGSALCLRQAADVWRLTVPAAALSVLVVAPWADPVIAGANLYFTVAATVGAYVCASLLEKARLSAFLSRRALSLQARQDALTGLPNRRYIEECLSLELAHFNRHKRVFSIAIVDIDHFKAVNDLYGHAIGDAALVHIAKLLAHTNRDSDALARWGGEEFMVLYRHADAAQASIAAERMRHHVEATPFSPGDGPARTITVSIGLAMALPGQGLDELRIRADRALYHAKAAGRNRVIADTDLALETAGP